MRLVLALCFLVATSVEAQRRPAVDVLDYAFTLTLPDAGSTIDGVAVLTVHRVARGGAADTLALDLLDLTVKSVRVGERDAAFTHTGGVIRLPFDATADTVRVTVTYSGAVKDGLIISTDGAGRWKGFGDNWPNRARHWLPSVDHPSDKATVTWTVIAPDDRKVVANGTRLEEATVAQKDDPDGHAGAPIALRRTTWRQSTPIPTYLMVIGAGPLVEYPLGNTACGFAVGGGCVAQMVYTFPEQRSSMPGFFAEADSVVKFFARTFGPFGYEKLAHVQSLTRFGGMENAGAIFYSDRAFKNGVGYGLIAHEVAHQWFGDMVTAREWPHIWLSEGFATYLAALYTQHSRGDAAFRADMARIRGTVLAAAAVAQRPVIDTIETTLTSLLNANSYQKGGWVAHMLRGEIGDQAFFRGARAYQERHRHGTALTDDLRSAMEVAAGRDLKPFFAQWLTRPGFPELETVWQHDAASGRVVLRVTQSDRFGFFVFPLTVEFTDGAGTVHRERVAVPAQRETVIALKAASRAAPRQARVDPDVALLARITER